MKVKETNKETDKHFTGLAALSFYMYFIYSLLFVQVCTIMHMFFKIFHFIIFVIPISRYILYYIQLNNFYYIYHLYNCMLYSNLKSCDNYLYFQYPLSSSTCNQEFLHMKFFVFITVLIMSNI